MAPTRLVKLPAQCIWVHSRDQGLTRDRSLGPRWLLAPFMRLLAHAVLALQSSTPGRIKQHC